MSEHDLDRIFIQLKGGKDLVDQYDSESDAKKALADLAQKVAQAGQGHHIITTMSGACSFASEQYVSAHLI